MLAEIDASVELPAIEILTDSEVQQLGTVTSASRVGITRHLVYVFAVIAWAQQKLYDIFKNDVDERIAKSKVFTEPWYIDTALNYQHGFALDDFGNYINGAATDQEIEDSKVVKKVAFERVQVQGHGVLRCKVATLENNDLVPLTANVLAGFEAYINRKSSFGRRFISISRSHDSLILNYDIYIDRLLIDETGARTDGSLTTPMQDAIDYYLKSLEFNGELVMSDLENSIQGVVGVAGYYRKSASSEYLSSATAITDDYIGDIEEVRKPFSGYMRLDRVSSIFKFIARD